MTATGAHAKAETALTLARAFPHYERIPATDVRSLPVDPKVAKLRADAMQIELEPNHGPERSDELRRLAVATIERGRKHGPAYASALRAAILVNRPLLELIAAVGEWKK